MDKIKLLTISVIVLLALNLATLPFLMFSHFQENNHTGNRPMPDQIIIEKLQFDSNQQKQYRVLIDWHRGQINEIDEKIRNTKNELYQQLLQPEINTKTKDSLVEALSNYQKQIENTNFKHFKDIKKLCRKEQLNAFDDLTKELTAIFSKRPR